ncbi:MAG: tagaturonate reductase [Acidobacteriota bacterium]
MDRLTKELIGGPAFQKQEEINLPPPGVYDLPEKVLQFGSGRFLRAFCDAFVDHANREGVFNGRVVIVQSTGGERSSILDQQDGLYTLILRGIREESSLETRSVLASVSRALSANQQWEEVLECARNPQLDVVISNTTEVGIVLDKEDSPDLAPPRSFPGKLTAFLYERYQAFSGERNKGLVVIPCELIEENGAVLKSIVLELARLWKLEKGFAGWVESANHFCNSLVDRIVTGSPAQSELEDLWEQLGYQDDLLTIAELYNLWAIEGDEALKRRLSFALANPGIVIAPDITPYREHKIRLLNGTHTLLSPTAFLYGAATVLESMNDPRISRFVDGLMRQEIAPSLERQISEEAGGAAATRAFIDEVLDRFRNPFIRHQVIDITLQATSKMRLRNVPTLKRHYEREGTAPQHFCLGFACYLLFMRGLESQEGKIYGRRQGDLYPINDDRAGYFMDRWKGVDGRSSETVREFVAGVCADSELWGMDLNILPGFSQTVAGNLSELLQRGPRALLEKT